MIPKEIKRLFATAKQDPNSQAYRHLVDDKKDREYIAKYCITEQQQEWLDSRGVDCDDLLHGYYPINDMEEVNNLFKDWNKKLGVEWFEIDEKTAVEELQAIDAAFEGWRPQKQKLDFNPSEVRRLRQLSRATKLSLLPKGLRK